MTALCCPDCGDEIVANLCQTDPNMSPESAEALRELVIAAHRKLAHPTDKEKET
ncbi:MAG: hypothetical protein KGL39_04250 [Patescibacteria group bacterium]|nr:hypothetical protein [Patescibacteria group bacterium]